MKGKNGQVGEELTVIKLFINNYTRDLFSNRYIKRIHTQILELNEYHFFIINAVYFCSCLIQSLRPLMTNLPNTIFAMEPCNRVFMV
jgi:hypothetical protein